MIRNARDVSAGPAATADVCIIGCGPAGISVARELAGTGASVLILESGGLQPGPEAQRLARGSSTGEPFLPLDRVRIRAVGGTSRHWLPLDTKDVRGAGVRMARLDATDFERLERVPYSGWPLSLDELEPFYERAESFLGLRVGDYGWEGLFEPGQAPDIGQRMEFLLIQMADPDIFYREARKLAALPRMTLITEATVLKVEYEHTRTRAVSALVTSPEGREFRVEAGFFVLAGGGIENARLLLLSSSAGGAMPANDNIGRFFMEHPALNTRAALFPAGAIFRPREHNGSRLLLTAGIRQEVRERQGLLQISLVADPATAALGSASGLSLARLYHAYQTRKVPDGALRDIARILRSPATSFSAGMGYVRNRWDGTDVFRLAVKLEQAPNPESRVVLSRKRDRFGQPKAELRWRLSAAEWQTFAAATRIVEEDFRGLGYKQISDDSGARPPAWPSFHHMGTTRMNVDPNSGVVDSDCLIHGTENVFVAGSSVFPTSGQANPTLTIVALAIRLGDHLKGRLGSAATQASFTPLT